MTDLTYSCSECGLTNNSEETIAVHCRSHRHMSYTVNAPGSVHNTISERYVCFDCNGNYWSVGSLSKHLSEGHGEVKHPTYQVTKCEDCGAVFGDSDQSQLSCSKHVERTGHKTKAHFQRYPHGSAPLEPLGGPRNGSAPLEPLGGPRNGALIETGLAATVFHGYDGALGWHLQNGIVIRPESPHFADLTKAWYAQGENYISGAIEEVS